MVPEALRGVKGQFQTGGYKATEGVVATGKEAENCRLREPGRQVKLQVTLRCTPNALRVTEARLTLTHQRSRYNHPRPTT